jgi:hypothetical protein
MSTWAKDSQHGRASEFADSRDHILLESCKVRLEALHGHYHERIGVVKMDGGEEAEAGNEVRIYSFPEFDF